MNTVGLFQMLPALRFANLTVVSFSLVVGLTAGLHEVLGLVEEASYLAALVAAFCVNFLGFRYYVYRAIDTPMGKQLFRFLVSSIAFRGGEFLSFLLLHTIAGVQYLLSVAIIMALSFVLKFLLLRTFVFS